MIKYILMVLWPLVLYIMSSIIGGVHERDPNTGEKTGRYTKGFAIVAVLPYIYWAATRDQFFGDTRAYVKNYWQLPTRPGDIIPYLQDVDKDPGFYALGIVIKKINGLLPDSVEIYFYLGIIAAIQIIPIALVLRKYSVAFITSLFIFVASTDYMSWMQNGIRQFTAVSIVFAASFFLFERKFIRYCLMVGFASLFHLSALMMIPVGFVARGRPWRVRTFALIAVVAVALMYVGSVTTWLDDALQGTQYEEVVSDWQSIDDDGTNPLRVLVYSVPMIMSFFGLRYIREAEDDVVDISCNMSIIASMIYVFSMLTSGIYAGRLPIYCSIYGMELLLPWLIERMFTSNSAKIMSMIMAVGFLAFYYYQMHYAWGLI